MTKYSIKNLPKSLKSRIDKINIKDVSDYDIFCDENAGVYNWVLHIWVSLNDEKWDLIIVDEHKYEFLYADTATKILKSQEEVNSLIRRYNTLRNFK